MCYEDLRQALAATAKERDALKKELAAAVSKRNELQADLDAAISDMGKMIDSCKACVHEESAKSANEQCDCDCPHCSAKCACDSCIEGSCFQWRGRSTGNG